MLYLVAVVAPPVALCLMRKPLLSVVALLLCITFIGWPLASIWAVLLVNQANAERRHRELLEAARRR